MGRKKDKGPVSAPAALSALTDKCAAAYKAMQARYADLVKAGVITVADNDRDGKHGTKRFVDSHADFIGTAGRIGDFIAAMNEPDVCGVCSRRGQSDICERCALERTKTMGDIYFNPEDGRGSNETE